MQNQFDDFNQAVEKKYLPNGQKDIYVGAKSLFNILNKEVDIDTCETIFIKAIAILALNSETFTLEKLKSHLTASGSEMLFSETQALHFHKFLQAVRKLAHDGKGLSQMVEEINQVDKANVQPIHTPEQPVQQLITRPYIVALALVCVITLLTGFYWYQLRPTNIRKSCYVEVYEATGAGNKSLTTQEKLYSTCLLKYGIVK